MRHSEGEQLRVIRVYKPTMLDRGNLPLFIDGGKRYQ